MSDDEKPDDWSERHRPRRFADVIGQDEAVATLRNQVRSGKPRHIAFFGPYGTGKTTLAKIYAQAINCEATASDDWPCRTCEACQYFEKGYRGDYEEYSSRSQAHMEELQQLEELVNYPIYGPLTTRVFFFDEAKGLSPSAVQILLKLLEPQGAPTVFLFAALEQGDVPPPLRSRCIPLTLRLFDEAAARICLDRVVKAENLKPDPGALELIAQVSQHGRDLVKGLERVFLSEGKRITVAGVQKALINDRVARMVSYFLALAAGDLDAQLQTVAGSALAPGDVLATIQQVLIYLRLRYVGTERERPSMLYRFLDLIDATDCRRIVACLQERSEAVGVPFPALFDEMLEFWAFSPARWTEEVMNLQLLRFHYLVNAHRRDLAPLQVGSAQQLAPLAKPQQPLREGEVEGGSSTRRFRRPPSWRAGATSGGPTTATRTATGADQLSVEQVAELYEAATFLVQTRGVLFNACLTLNWASLGVGDDRQAIDLTSQLAHELGLRLVDWGVDEAGGFHRISLHEGVAGDMGLRSHLVGYVPHRHAERSKRWVGRFLSRRIPGVEADPAVAAIEIGPSEPKRSNVPRHWELMRLLWRGLDPIVTVDTKDGKQPTLVELLKLRRNGRIGAVDGRRYQISDAINEGARKMARADRMTHLSVFADAGRHGRAAWKCLDQGWELAEHEERQAELKRRQDRETALRRAFWVPEDRLYSSTYSLQMEAELRERPEDPQGRVRKAAKWHWWTNESNDEIRAKDI